MLVDYVRIMKWNGKGQVTFNNNYLVANAGTDIIALDKDKNGVETVVLDGSLSSNYGGVISKYSWTENGKEIATGQMPTVQLSRGVHTITLTVSDDKGNTATDQVIATVTTGGSSPTADAGKDITVNDDNNDDLVQVTLDGSGSSDPNDSPLTYSWTENGNEIANSVKPVVSLKTGKHVITLTVTNEDKATGTDDVIVNVIDPNNVPPVANPGTYPTFSDTDGDDKVTVLLDGSGSYDTDGTIVSYLWTEKGQTIATTKTASVVLSTGKHTITLQVTDNDGISSSADVLITVVDPDNVPPVANAGTYQTIVDADNSGSEAVTLDGSASYDTDGTIVDYSWKENNVEIANGKTAQVTLALGIHNITLYTTDNDGDVSSATVVIKVAQLPVANAGNDIKVIDNNKDGVEAVTLDGSGSVANSGNISSYSWTENNTVIGSNKTVTCNFGIGTHLVTLTVTNDYGLTASDNVTVIVANPDNKAPVANAGTDASLLINGSATTVQYKLDGSGSYDPDGSIVSYQWLENGVQIATGVTAPFDFTLGVHNILLIVTDNEGATANASLVVTVKQGSCTITNCYQDYTAEVISSDAGNTTINFIPSKDGNGNSTCLLYYGNAATGVYPGNKATPNVPFKISNITNGQTVYFYYTYSLSSGGEQNTSGCRQSFTVGSCGAATAVVDVHDVDVTLYPSPVEDILKIKVDNDSQVTKAVVFNSFGSKIMEERNALELNMGGLTPGLYIVQLTVDNRMVVKKVIKK